MFVGRTQGMTVEKTVSAMGLTEYIYKRGMAK